jgi:hypothetical protein
MFFNAVVEQVMRQVKQKWAAKKYGVQIGHFEDTIVTNLSFAVDILLAGRSLPQIERMLADIIEEGCKVGLELHPQKTKIQHNGIGYGSCVRSASVRGMNIEVMDPSTSNMYLGRALCLIEPHQTELNHRIKWAKFGVFRNELTDKSVPLPLRCKLFQSALTPTVLYGGSSWVLTSVMEAQLKSTRMKMLRIVLGKRRLSTEDGLETWVDWVKRTTRDARLAMEEYGVADWVVDRRSRVRCWRNRLTNMNGDRWAKIAFAWAPEGSRRRGRPRLRWKEQEHS